MIDPDIVRFIANQQYNIMPYGPVFFLGCCTGMYAYVEVDQSHFGIPWLKFVTLLGATLGCFTVFMLV